MKTAGQIAADAMQHGYVRLHGKLEFPIGATLDEACGRLQETATRVGGAVFHELLLDQLLVYPTTSRDFYYLLQWECRSAPGPTHVARVMTDTADLRERRKAEGNQRQLG